MPIPGRTMDDSEAARYITVRWVAAQVMTPDGWRPSAVVVVGCPFDHECHSTLDVDDSSLSCVRIRFGGDHPRWPRVARRWRLA